MMDRKGLVLILIVSGALMLAATQMSEGFYNIDELVYFLGAETMWKEGSFEIRNGFDQFPSDNLRIWLLSEGPSGLTPQYPVGTTLAAAPLMVFLGSKALIYLNVLAGIGTLPVVYAIALRLFSSHHVAFGALVLLVFFSFWIEFVLAHWPHSTSIFFANLALLLFLVSIDKEQKAWPMAVLSGVSVGIGMFFRLEAILLLPAFTSIAILFAARPVSVLAGGVAGFLPVLGLMALSNNVRFGSFMPLSYGTTGGATVASHYIFIGLALIAGLAALVVVRMRGGLGRGETRLALVLAAIGLGAVALSPYAFVLTKLVDGFHALIIDATTVEDPRNLEQRGSDGTLLFWGASKKALVQSMPWLGCLALLAGASRLGHMRSIIIVFTLFLVWSLPFVMRSWHGGFGSNMRYFLPALPVLFILASSLLYDLVRKANVQSYRLPVVLAMGTFAFAFVWALLLQSRIAVVHQPISLTVFAVVTLNCLFTTLTPRKSASTTAVLSLSVAFGLSAFLSLDDLQSSQARRAETKEQSLQTASIPGPVVIYAAPETVSQAFDNAEQLVALLHPVSRKVDVEFLNAACASGYRILLASDFESSFEQENRTVFELGPAEATDIGLMEMECAP